MGKGNKPSGSKKDKLKMKKKAKKLKVAANSSYTSNMSM